MTYQSPSSTTSARVSVQTPGGRYEIQIGRDLGPFVRSFRKEQEVRGRAQAVLVDAQVAAKWPAGLEALQDLPTFPVPSGETSKSADQLLEVWRFLAARAFDRQTLIWAVGGGVVGDLAGFVAASYLRGVDFVQVPTTLLAMVDSAVGGKTGINLPEGKNLVGAFHQPIAVFAHLEALDALPPREFNAGMAEVLKYGLLADRALWERLVAGGRRDARSSDLAAIVQTCCEIKARIVQADERETASQGGRALLNLGHTFAHAIENVAGYGEILHGEAVAIGLVLAARLSVRLGTLSESDANVVETAVAEQQLPTEIPASLPAEALLDAMTRDKKARQGKPKFIVLRAIGEAAIEPAVDPGLVRELLREAGASS